MQQIQAGFNSCSFGQCCECETWSGKLEGQRSEWHLLKDPN